MRACPADGETARWHGFGPGVVSPHHGRGMDRSSWGFGVRWAKTAYLRTQVGARGKLFSLAKVNATTACEAIRAIEQLSATKGSGTSHTCDVPRNDLPPLSWTQIGSPENDSVRVRARQPPTGRRTTGGRPPGGRAAFEGALRHRAGGAHHPYPGPCGPLHLVFQRAGGGAETHARQVPRGGPADAPAGCPRPAAGVNATAKGPRALVVAQANASMWHGATKRSV